MAKKTQNKVFKRKNTHKSFYPNKNKVFIVESIDNATLVAIELLNQSNIDSFYLKDNKSPTKVIKTTLNNLFNAEISPIMGGVGKNQSNSAVMMMLKDLDNKVSSHVIKKASKKSTLQINKNKRSKS